MNRRRFFTISSTAAAAVAGGVRAESGAGAPVLRFGLLTDIQYADLEPEGERHYRASIPKLKAAVAALAAAKPAFTLHLGDFIDRNFASFAAVLPLLEPLGQPVRHLLGNHDYSVADTDKGRVPSTLGMPHDYYTFSNSGLRVVMLDTTELAPYKHAAGSEGERAATAALKRLAATGAVNAQPWNGGVSATQLGWLERELGAAAAAGERVIVCGHHPLLPADGHQIWNADEVVALIDRHPAVIAWFNGHNHAGEEAVRNGVPYLTFKSILHHPEQTAYALVRVTADRLEITGHGREKSRRFPLRPVP
jgi:3',5'-cyclic AMP phosphodiesterase CpdA